MVTPLYILGRSGADRAVRIDGTNYLLPTREAGRHLSAFSVTEAMAILDGEFGAVPARYVMACSEVELPCTTLLGVHSVDEWEISRLTKVLMPTPCRLSFRPVDDGAMIDTLPKSLAELAILRRHYEDTTQGRYPDVVHTFRPDPSSRMGRVSGRTSRLTLLDAIHDAGIPLTLRKLVAWTGISQTNAHYHMQRLLDAGIVEHCSGYALTPEGISLMEQQTKEGES